MNQEPISAEQNLVSVQPTDVKQETRLDREIASFKIMIGILLFLLLIIFGGMAYLYILFSSAKQTKVVPPVQVTSATPQPSTVSQIEVKAPAQKTYEDKTIGLSFRYYPNYTPTQLITKSPPDGAIFSITTKPNFNISKLKICPEIQDVNNICIIPGKNWNQPQDILPISVGGKSAYGLFIYYKGSVIHTIQIEKPVVEFSMSVDGVGGEETFQEILSTFRFKEDNSQAENWDTRTVTKFAADGSFNTFKITYPPSWDYQINNLGEYTRHIILTRNTMTIDIFQGNFGGGACLYPNDPPFDGPSGHYSSFIDIKRPDDKGMWRLSFSGVQYSVCSGTSGGTFGQPTGIGGITVIDSTGKYPEELLKEVVQILEKVEIID